MDGDDLLSAALCEAGLDDLLFGAPDEEPLSSAVATAEPTASSQMPELGSSQYNTFDRGGFQENALQSGMFLSLFEKCFSIIREPINDIAMLKNST